MINMNRKIDKVKELNNNERIKFRPNSTINRKNELKLTLIENYRWGCYGGSLYQHTRVNRIAELAQSCRADLLFQARQQHAGNPSFRFAVCKQRRILFPVNCPHC